MGRKPGLASGSFQRAFRPSRAKGMQAMPTRVGEFGRGGDPGKRPSRPRMCAMGVGALALAALLCAVLASHPAPAADFYVDGTSGSDGNDGLTWATAKATVQAALDAAGGAAGADTVSVAAGHYWEKITVPADVSLLGGFPPGGGARDPKANPTILGGDTWHRSFIDGPVVDFPPGSDGTLFEGFIVQGGSGRRSGTGAMRIVDAAPVIRGNLIQWNASEATGGILVLYTRPGAVARIEGNLFLWNSMEAVWIDAPDSMDLGTILKGNVIQGSGGGVGAGAVCFRGRGRIEDIVLDYNASGLDLNGSVDVFNALIYWTWAEYAVHLECSGGTYRLENVTIADGTKFAIHTEGSQPTNAEVVHSIIWGNDPGQIAWNCPVGSTLTVESTLVQGGFPGGTNILDQDPLFFPGPLGDYYVSETGAGQAATSPAVDAGSWTAASVGLDARTTRTDSVADTGAADLGYHYRSLPFLTILRGTVADNLTPYTSVAGLPFADAGVLGAPGLERLYYLVPEAENELGVRKDTRTGSVVLEFLPGRSWR